MVSGLQLETLMRKTSLLGAEAADVNEFRSLANDLVSRAVGWDFAVWSTVDPATFLFTSCNVLGIPAEPENERKFFDLEFAGDDVNLFTDLARNERPAESLHAATQGSPERSRRFRELMQPAGLGDELRAVFRDGDAAWGALVAGRSFGAKPFSESETAVVAKIGPVIAKGLRCCLLRAAAKAPHRLVDGPGMLLLAEDGRVLETTPEAERWMSLVGSSSDWQTAVRAVASRVRADACPVSLPLRTQSGQWIVLHGSSTASGSLAVIVEEARRNQLTMVISELYGLTPRERALLELVSQGRSTREISQVLKISPYTVQDHLKSVFDKLGVRSRRELVTLLFNGHYVERRRAGSTPGPYGWYLDD